MEYEPTMSNFNDDYENTQKTEDEKTLLFRNIDAKVDPFSMSLEKHIQKLPDSLQFIKEYLYFEFLPQVDFWLDELEKIKTTSNYDEQIAKIRPVLIRQSSHDVTCFDLLGNHNIKHAKISRMIYGTSGGSLIVFDIEADKVVYEKKISQKNRVDCISTATTKYFDTYLTRIAVSCRSEPTITILSYNHSFSTMNIDCVINTNDQPGLGSLINTLSFSKDGFYLSAIDYAGGVRVYKFHEIPLNTSSINVANSTIDSINSKESKKEGKKEKEPSQKELKEEKSTKESGKDNIDGKDVYVFITYVKCKEGENFTILPNEASNTTENNTTKEKGKQAEKPQKGGKDKGKDKGKGKEDKEAPVILDETQYNIKSEYDEEKQADVSLFQKFDKHHPKCHYVQKKFIFEEKYNTGYSSSTVTTGLYIAFSNSTCFKYISLYPYLTENMKTIFKVSKIKTSNSLSIEDSMTLNSQMAKKEKEFLNFIKSKLDSTTPQVKLESQSQAQTISDKEKGGKEKEKEKEKDNKKDAKKDNSQQKVASSLTKINLSDITKNEICFTTLFNISAMVGQKVINNVNNLLGIGMTDGSILVWDCELHTDKFLFQKNSRFEITSLLIDENYLLSGSKEGSIYIYDLITGKEIYNCAHNPYETIPLSFIYPLFPFIGVAFDEHDIMCVYNTKEKSKIGKILLNDIDSKSVYYKIGYINRFMCNFNDEFMILVCEKSEEKKPNTNLIDLIKFQDTRKEFIQNKPEETSTNFFNKRQIESNPPQPEVDPVPKENQESNPDQTQQEVEKPEPITKITIKQKYFLLFRIRDILFKCYPNLIYAYKKGLSLKKIMKKYTSDSFPSFDRSKLIYLIFYSELNI